VLELGQAFVRLQSISKQRRPGEYVLSDFRLKRAFLTVGNNLSANPAIADLAATLQDPHHGGLVFATSSGDFLRSLVSVHVSRLATDESFVGFNLTGELVAALFVLRESNPVQHEPSGLLGDAERTRDFATGDSFFGIVNQPHGGKPLVQPKRGILKDGSNLDRELPLRVPVAALLAPV
jgi:hypothetical protein